MRPATDLNFLEDYPNFPEFAEHGIPLDLMSAYFILKLQDIREDAGVPLYPSPDHEGWARLRGRHESRHWAVDRLSDAGDVFPARGRVIEFFNKALQYNYFSGVGIYADTIGPDGNLWPMIHLDSRPKTSIFKTVWTRFSDPMKGINKKYVSLGGPEFNAALKEIIRLDRRTFV